MTIVAASVALSIGGVGAGIYGFLLFAVLAVFVAGLMVGRTPEYVGKKIESREVKLAVLAIAILPLFILYFGIGPPSKIAFGVTHGMFPIMLTIIAGVQNLKLKQGGRLPAHLEGRRVVPVA